MRVWIGGGWAIALRPATAHLVARAGRVLRHRAAGGCVRRVVYSAIRRRGARGAARRSAARARPRRARAEAAEKAPLAIVGFAPGRGFSVVCAARRTAAGGRVVVPFPFVRRARPRWSARRPVHVKLHRTGRRVVTAAQEHLPARRSRARGNVVGRRALVARRSARGRWRIGFRVHEALLQRYRLLPESALFQAHAVVVAADR